MYPREDPIMKCWDHILISSQSLFYLFPILSTSTSSKSISRGLSQRWTLLPWSDYYYISALSEDEPIKNTLLFPDYLLSLSRFGKAYTIHRRLPFMWCTYLPTYLISSRRWRRRQLRSIMFIMHPRPLPSYVFQLPCCILRRHIPF